VVVTETCAPAMPMRSGRPTQQPVAAAVGDPPQLLVVLVDERARVIMDVADRDTGQPVGIAQPGCIRSG
jgi:hypothetical protein